MTRSIRGGDNPWGRGGFAAFGGAYLTTNRYAGGRPISVFLQLCELDSEAARTAENIEVSSLLVARGQPTFLCNQSRTKRWGDRGDPTGSAKDQGGEGQKENQVRRVASSCVYVRSVYNAIERSWADENDMLENAESHGSYETQGTIRNPGRF